MNNPKTVDLPAASVAVGLAILGPFIVTSMVGVGVLAVVLSQILCFAAPAWLAAAITGGHVPARLGVRCVNGRLWLATLAVALSYWLVNLALVAPTALTIFGESDGLKELSGFIGSYSIVVQLVAFALLPAICEEILMRGAVARSLDRHMPRPLAIVLSALLFAALHWPLARMLPSFVTGLTLAAIVLWSGSVLPAMAVHFTNNAFALLLAHQPQAKPFLERLEAFPVASITAATVVFTGGMWAINRLSQKNQ